MRLLIKLLSLSALAIVGVMAVSASAAQANFKFLLNGVAVNPLHVLLTGLAGYIKAENGLKITCAGAMGTAKATPGAKATGEASATFTGCKWEGNPNCTIKDPVGGIETIVAKGSGEVTMPSTASTEYFVKATSGVEPFTTIISEGAKCTIPEEEEVTGSASAKITNAETAAVSHTASLEAGSLKLGNSKVTELVGEVHITDALDPTATLAIELCGLTGKPAC